MAEISNDTIEKASRGDVDAFEVIYKEYFSFVANLALRVVNRREEAEEVAQDVFMTIFRNLKNFRFESSLKTWIYRVTVNTAINHAKRFSKHEAVEYTEALSVAAPVDNAVQENLSEENISRLLTAVTADQRACLVLRAVEGLSYQEIADTLKIPVNTVRSRIKRAREAMIALRKEVIKNAL